MDALRHFQHAHAFRLLAQDLAGALTRRAPRRPPLGTRRHRPRRPRSPTVWRHLSGPGAPSPRFAIVGYGKLGGKELGYASDLDLVFLFDADDDDDTAPGAVRAARAAARDLAHQHHRRGPALRHRPAPAAGRRRRADGVVDRRVPQIPAHPGLALGAPGADPGALRHRRRRRSAPRSRPSATRSCACRAIRSRWPRTSSKCAVKMAAGHPNPTDRFDLKHDPGGMVDVEFAVQYLVLAHAAAHPALTRNLGNIALLRIAGELGLVPAATGGGGRRCVSRFPPPAAPDPAHRRAARAGRPGVAAGATRTPSPRCGRRCSVRPGGTSA